MDLTNLNVTELSIQEQKETEGGFWGWIALGVLIIVGLIVGGEITLTDGNGNTGTIPGH